LNCSKTNPYIAAINPKGEVCEQTCGYILVGGNGTKTYLTENMNQTKGNYLDEEYDKEEILARQIKRKNRA